ncbi:hypothetical protein CVIC9261_06335 [Campylobacter vicugnae]|uniref:Uncharacterized protein n=1 Tax=Campylobacter vicugnae TaxID=1660076 RepID=A0ABZ2E6G9_9BACT
MSDSPDVYEKFYEKPMPLFVAPSTNEGFIQYLNELDRSGIGSGFILSGEFGAELLTSPTIIANLQLLAELYDEGKKEVKVLKDKEKQSDEIKICQYLLYLWEVQKISYLMKQLRRNSKLNLPLN